ncbi:hypothetical protein MPF_1222 [Methanohalophilus portucalensis FDF-1]|uniref:Uncharacterized protein n=1 Tax=Methanohalophilus portucalensis FDF-1 TaxID=523843 RepID=A0A1L9C4A2_9EURY|nr:hypothetical protein MPF_1222 [Methanohalophilus portucalensis FDF-1]
MSGIEFRAYTKLRFRGKREKWLLHVLQRVHR